MKILLKNLVNRIITFPAMLKNYCLASFKGVGSFISIRILGARLWLTNAEQAYIAYCLVNTPDSIIEQEKYYLLKKMDVISEESPEFVKESAKITFNMTFDDIDVAERILLFKVERDEHEIMKIQNKVERAREYLVELESTHKNFNIGKI